MQYSCNVMQSLPASQQPSLSAGGGGVTLLHELMGLMRRSLTQQAPIREALYQVLPQTALWMSLWMSVCPYICLSVCWSVCPLCLSVERPYMHEPRICSCIVSAVINHMQVPATDFVV